MPPDQAIAYVKSMAQQGVAPLVDLYAMLNQFQRLQQPQAQAPQTPPTVKDQINMAAQQQAQQQAMMQGLGGMNAGTMENPQFAGGGIIAFQTGGQPPAQPRSGYQGLIDLLKNRYGGDEDAYIEQEAERARARREKFKVGEYGEAAAERKKDLETQEQERARYEQELRRASMAEFFADLGERSAKPGATFMGALAGAGGTLGKSRKEAAKELREIDALRREARLKMIEAQELRREGDITGANQAYKAAQNAILGIQQKEVDVLEGRKTAVAQAEAQKSDVDRIRARALRELDDLRRQGKANTPEYDQLEKFIQTTYPQVMAAQARSFNQAPWDLKMRYNAALTGFTKVAGYSKDDPARIEAEQTLAAVERELQEGGYRRPSPEEARSLDAQAGAADGDWKDL